MQRLHYYIRFIFGITRWEAFGIWTLMALILFSLLFQWWISQIPQIETFEMEELKRLEQELAIKNVSAHQPTSLKKNTSFTKFTQSHPVQTRRIQGNELYNINKLDSVAWEKLPGIGPAFARRIVLYREKLGGFYEINQLKEIYGLDSNWVNQFKSQLRVGDGVFRKLKINQAAWNELRHPYLPYGQLKIFLRYREQHGPIKNEQQLKEIILLDPKIWSRLLPYLSFD